MGGKRDQRSSTSTQIPPWLVNIVKPLLSGSAERLQTFQNQGWDSLQGNPQGTTGDPVVENPYANPDPNIDPRLKSLYGGGGGGGRL